ncbi:MAG: response regulator [Hyphomicrobiaceae bacterium]
MNIYLPRADEGAAQQAPVRNGELAVSAGESVLLVEDNAEVREVTRLRLEGLGYRVVEAENGAMALALLSEVNGVDIVFSDVVMGGGLSGFDVAREVRARWPQTRVLLTSGYPDDILREQEPALHELRILRKPYSRAELATTLREILDA